MGASSSATPAFRPSTTATSVACGPFATSRSAGEPSKRRRCWAPSSIPPTTPSSARTSLESSPVGTRAPSACSDTPPSEAVGQPITMLIPPDRLDEETHILERIKAGARGPLRDHPCAEGRVAPGGLAHDLPREKRRWSHRRRIENRARHHGAQARRGGAAAGQADGRGGASRAKDEFLAMLVTSCATLGAIGGAVSVLYPEGQGRTTRPRNSRRSSVGRRPISPGCSMIYST